MQIKLLFIQEFPKLFFSNCPQEIKKAIVTPFAPLLFIVPQLTKITLTLGNPDLKYNLLKLLLASDELLLQGNGVTQHKLSNKLV